MPRLRGTLIPKQQQANGCALQPSSRVVATPAKTSAMLGCRLAVAGCLQVQACRQLARHARRPARRAAPRAASTAALPTCDDARDGASRAAAATAV